MTVLAFPDFSRRPIIDPADIDAIEGAITALTGVVVAQGGFVALAGVDLLATPVAARAELLTEMYDAGEVIVGWQDGQGGGVRNAVIERLEGPLGAGFVVEVFEETADGHLSIGAVADRRAQALQAPLCAVAAGGSVATLKPRGAALAGLAGGADNGG